MAKKIMRLLMVMLLSVFTIIGITKGSSVYADDSFTITFHSGDDGEFEDGSTTNVMEYGMVPVDAVRYSHTPNISDDGTRSGGMGTSLRLKDVVTIPGADHLRVEITYGSYGYSSTYANFVIIPGEYAGTVSSTYSYAYPNLLARLYGYTNSTTPRTGSYDIANNDSVTFITYSGTSYNYNSSTYAYGYGYYAVVTGYDSNGNIIQEPKKEIIVGEYKDPMGYENDGVPYKFAGWYDNAALSGEPVDVDSVTSSIDLYAAYEEDVIVKGTFGCPWMITGDGELVIGKDGQECTLANGASTTSADWPWKTGNQIISTKIKGTVHSSAGSLQGMFAGLNNKTIDLTGFDTSNATDFSKMFDANTSLTSLNLGNDFDTSNGTDFNNMFFGCYYLTSLDLGNKFDTSNGTNFRRMFHLGTDGQYPSSSLTSLNLGDKFDTSNGTNFEEMFRGCSSLSELNLGDKFDTSNGTNFNYMFQSCSSLTSLDLGEKFDTSNGTNFSYMFYGCSKLTSLDLGEKFDTSNGTNFSNMFWNCNSLASLDLGNKFDTSNGTSFGGMFYGCSKLVSLDLGDKFDTSNGTNFSAMFAYCSSLTSLNLGDKFDTSNGTTFGSTFQGCSSLTSLDLGDKFDTSSGTNFSYMFQFCSSLVSLDLGNKFDTSSGTNFSYMFSFCSSLTSLEFGDKFDTSNGTNFGCMFDSCSSLESLNLSSFNTSKATSIFRMFASMTSLKSIIIPPTFTFNGNGFVAESALLPNPAPPSTTWKQVYDFDTFSYPTGDDQLKLTATQLRDNWDPNDMAGIWIWSELELDDLDIDIIYDENIEHSSSAKWKRLSEDTWEYVFDVFDDTLQYYLYEDPIEGFHSDIDPETGYVVIYDKKGEITNTTNTELGSLTVSKNVVEETPGDHPARGPFNIQITLEGLGIPAEGTKIIDGVVFKNGVGNILLSDGESKTISGLPEGVTYSVLELDEPVNCITTYSNQSGNIEVGANDAVITNTYTEVEPEGSRTSIIVGKHVVNAPESKAGTEYSILFNARNMDPSYEYTITNSNGTKSNFVTDEKGTATALLKLKAEENATITPVPVDAEYQFVESPGDWYASYEITNADVYGTINQPKNENLETEKGLSTTFETAEDNEVSTVTFTNTYENSQRLRITKNVTDDPNDATKFAFTISFSNMEEGTAFDSSIGRIIADDEGLAEKEFYLAAGDVVEFEGIPSGTKYQITEGKSALYVASYEIIDDSGEYDPPRIAKDSDANTIKNKELSTATETVDLGEDVLVRFSNSKENGSLTVSKTGSEDIPETEEFDIQITLTGDRFGISGTFACTGLDEDTVTFDKNGQAVIRIKKGDSATISGLPVGATYSVEELDPDGLYKKTYSNNTGVIPAGNSTAIVNNEILSDSDISISKRVTGNMGSRDKNFEFSISLLDNGAPVTGEFVAEGTDAEYITFNNLGVATFTLSHGQTITIKDVPIDAEYTVTETDYSSEGYTTTSNNASGTISENSDDNHVTFINQNGAALPTAAHTAIGAGVLILVIAIFGLIKTRHKKEA